MSKLDRLLTLVHALAEDADGLTLDAMAERIGVNRRTAERMRNILMTHFDLDSVSDGRSKRWRITGRLGRMFTQPTAAELAALQAEVDAKRKRGQTARSDLLGGLLSKVRGALDSSAKRRTGPDLEALAKAQRVLVMAGPTAIVTHETLAAVQGAIIAGSMLEFEYRAEGRSRAAWRKVIPCGLIHGQISYLVGMLPKSRKPAVYFRLDRMENARLSEEPGIIPDGFDLDEWLSRSFGVWRDEEVDVVLKFVPTSAAKARAWRFHPKQSSQNEDDGSLIVKFKAGGLRELAEHLFAWGDDVEIVSPKALRIQLVQMLTTALKGHNQDCHIRR